MPIIKLLRVHQWIKNLFVFVPAFFAAKLLEVNVLELSLTFLAFSLVSSAVYVINDYRDIEADKLHPVKKNRPLAAGTVSKQTGIILFIFSLVFGFGLATYLSMGLVVVLALYFIINIGYSFGLKNVPILELFFVASGFLLRVVAGSVVTDIHMSHWAIIMVFLLALFLIIAKRRDDLVMYLNTNTAPRKAIKNYNLQFINSTLSMISGVIIVVYLMYCLSPEVIERFNNEYLYGTSLFIIAGIFRYLQITMVDQKSGSPVKTLYTDQFIIATVLGWVASFFLIIYFNKL